MIGGIAVTDISRYGCHEFPGTGCMSARLPRPQLCFGPLPRLGVPQSLMHARMSHAAGQHLVSGARSPWLLLPLWLSVCLTLIVTVVVIYLVPGLSRINWVLYASARRLLRGTHYRRYIILSSSVSSPSYSSASAARSRICQCQWACACPSSHECGLVYCRLQVALCPASLGWTTHR